MSKLTLEIPDALHRTVKSFASAHGETIKDFFIQAATEKLQKSTKIKTTLPMKKAKKTQKKYLTEKEADKMLKPYLIRMIQRIESGEEKVYSKEEAFKMLRDDKTSKH